MGGVGVRVGPVGEHGGWGSGRPVGERGGGGQGGPCWRVGVGVGVRAGPFGEWGGGQARRGLLCSEGLQGPGTGAPAGPAKPWAQGLPWQGTMAGPDPSTQPCCLLTLPCPRRAEVPRGNSFSSLEALNAISKSKRAPYVRGCFQQAAAGGWGGGKDIPVSRVAPKSTEPLPGSHIVHKAGHFSEEQAEPGEVEPAAQVTLQTGASRGPSDQKPCSLPARRL